MPSGKIRVCHFTSVHNAYDTRIFVKMCRSLAKAGYSVSLVTPNAQMEVRDGVGIIGVPVEGGRLKRMLSNSRKIFDVAKSLDADIYHFHDPELLRYSNDLIAAGKIVIYDAHEDLPRQLQSKPYLPVFFGNIAGTVLELYENNKIKKLSAVVTATPHIRDRFLKFNSNTIDVCNYPTLDEIPSPVPFDQKERSVCFISGLTAQRGIRELIAAMENALFKLHLGGKFSPPALQDEMEKLPGWKNVNYLGFLDRTGIVDVLKRSKVGMVTMQPGPNLEHALPVKMFEYMASGIPFVATDTPVWRNIAEKYNCGVCVNINNPSAIRSAVELLLNDDAMASAMGMNGRRAVEEKFNWGIEEQKLLQLYRSLS